MRKVSHILLGAAVALLADLHLAATVPLLGQDSEAFVPRWLGLLVALPLGFCLGGFSAGRLRALRWPGVTLFLAGSLALLALLRAGTGPWPKQLGSLSVGMVAALPLLLVGTGCGLCTRGAPGPLLLGAAAGLLLHEFILLPVLGWTLTTLAAALSGVLALIALHPRAGAEAGTGQECERVSRADALLGVILSALLGVGVGGIASLLRLGLLPRLSGTRPSFVLLVGLLLVGLGLGSLLLSVSRLERARPPLRVLVALASAVAAVLVASWQIGRGQGPVLSALPTDRISGILSEAFLILSAASIPSLLLGAGLRAASRTVAHAMLLGPCALLGFLLFEPWGLELSLLSPLGGQSTVVFERKPTRDGLLSVARTLQAAPRPRVHWNRNPVTRGTDQAMVEQEEIHLPARLAPSLLRTLVVGSALASHREAIPVSGFRSLDYLDPVPALVPGTPRGEETDPWRLLRSSPEASHDNVIVLSRPFLAAGAGNLLSREGLHALRQQAGEPGCLCVWVDPRAMTVSSLGILLRTFSECFADARLWIARSGLEGPLLCLETGGVASPLEGTASFLAGTLRSKSRLDSFAVSTRDRPALEASLPLSALVIEVPDPDVLRFVDSLLTWGQDARPPESYILEALALHAEEQEAPTTRFPTKLDWIRISRRSLDLLGVALELFPDHEGLLDLAVTLGETLRFKSGYETLLEVVPLWLEASPDAPGLLELLGLVHHDLLDHDLAVPLLERAGQARPDSKRIHHALGLSYSALSRYEEAMAVLSVAQALDVEDEIVARDLGLACYAAGDWEQALPLLEAAALSFPRDEGIRAAIAAMRGEGE